MGSAQRAQDAILTVMKTCYDTTSPLAMLKARSWFERAESARLREACPYRDPLETLLVACPLALQGRLTVLASQRPFTKSLDKQTLPIGPSFVSFANVIRSVI